MRGIFLILLLTFSSITLASGGHGGRFSVNHFLFGGLGQGYGGDGGAGGAGGSAFSAIHTPRFAMTAYASPIQATIPCALSISEAVQLILIGQSVGLTYKDKECNGRELERTIIALFQAELLEKEEAKSIAKDTLCNLPAAMTSRVCLAHNAWRRKTFGTDGNGFGENQSANFQAILPWNWLRGISSWFR